MINLDEYSDIGTYWVALYVQNNDDDHNNNNDDDNNNVIYFDSFGVEHIPKEIKGFINNNNNIITNIFRIQAYNSIMCGSFCIGFFLFYACKKNFN